MTFRWCAKQPLLAWLPHGVVEPTCGGRIVARCGRVVIQDEVFRTQIEDPFVQQAFLSRVQSLAKLSGRQRSHPLHQTGRAMNFENLPRNEVPVSCVRQPAGHRVTHHPFGAALATPRIRLSDPALDHRPIRRETLPDGYETELVEAAERGQIRGREGSVEHVEVFQMDSLGTSIMEDLDPYPETNATTLSTAKSRKNAVTLHEVWADVLACHIAHRAVLDLLVGKVINHAEKEMHSHQRHRDGRDHPSGTRNNGASFLRHETLVSSFDAIAQYDVPAETMPGASRRPGLLSILAFRRAPWAPGYVVSGGASRPVSGPGEGRLFDRMAVSGSADVSDVVLPVAEPETDNSATQRCSMPCRPNTTTSATIDSRISRARSVL